MTTNIRRTPAAPRDPRTTPPLLGLRPASRPAVRPGATGWTGGDEAQFPAPARRASVPPAPTPASKTLDALAPFIVHGRTGQPVNLRVPYRSEMSFDAYSAWESKDAGALEAWQAPGMTRALAFATWHNTAIDGDHLGRALSTNVDATLWYRSLTARGVIAPVDTEWRQAIELASLMLDIGNDGRGNTGYLEIYKDAQELPPSLLNKVALLVAGSGRTGIPVEATYSRPTEVLARARDFALNTLAALRDPEAYEKDRSGLFPAEARDESTQTLVLRLADLVTPDFLQTPDGRDAFASSLLVVKLADMSRGQAYRLVAASPDAGIAAMDGNTRLRGAPLIESFQKARAAAMTATDEA